MLTNLVVLVALLEPAAAPEGAGKCPEPIEAVMMTMPATPEWVGALVIDADGDEVPEVFIADTNRGGNAGEPWRLYRRTQSGSYEVVGSVFFHDLGFKLEASRLETYWRLNAGSGRFITYRVSATAIEEIERTELLRSEDAEFTRRWNAILAWRPNLQDKQYAATRREWLEGEEERVVCRGIR